MKSFNKALESIWIKKYLDNDNHGKWKLLYDSKIHDLGEDVFFKGTLDQNDLAKFIHTSDAFTTEILKIWSEISYNGNITSTEQLLSLPLWQNSLVRIGKKTYLLQIMVFKRNLKGQTFNERRRQFSIFH